MNLNYKDVQKLELTVTTEQIDNNGRRNQRLIAERTILVFNTDLDVCSI